MGDHEMEPYLLRIASGDKDALRQLYDAYSHAVFLLALSILKHREQAEDVMQNVFLKIWAGAGSYRKGRSPKAWIIYRLTDTITAKDVALGETLPDSSYPYRAVEGVDPSVEFAIKLRSCTLLYHYVMDDTFTWNGAVYRIDEPSGSTGEQGDKIGTVNGHAIYSIQGCDPSRRIRFQFEKASYTDAVRQ